MKTVSSYGVEIKKQNIPLHQTLRIYRQAVSYLTKVYHEVWEGLSEIENTQKRFNEAEHLVHNTKKNVARFDFDQRFVKMPSYLRRAAIQHALGSVSSYKTRMKLWENGDLSGKPKLVYENHAMPVFYRDVMYKPSESGEDIAYLKLYDGYDWKWFRVSLLHTDMEYLRKHWSGVCAMAPVLEKKHQKYFLRFSYTEDVILTKHAVNEQIICSIDLGSNTDAVCTIMRSDGTILGRKFIDFPSDKDRLYHVLGRIRRFQREHGSGQIKRRWTYAKRLNMELSRKIANAIVTYAGKYQADVLVFEYLEIKGVISGKKRQQLHMWRKRDIQNICEHQAHRHGMRLARVCAYNTSRLAYDGSGMVERSKKNHSLCVFKNGKTYNCDLSASYNIGARYFIRELLKPFPETERSLLEAKVPSIKRRTSCVYADLRVLHDVLADSKSA
ncbi:IS200/IS605 family element transposase accessory protein TnpB [Clostridium sp. AM33-3]|uniref:IS200/IS605 family element transposase accessory protein TnpB n=1 Tax=Clostridium sp. AM33-3 TaxID=2292304 RepID=UPI000E4B9FE4|nr:IS200/IS605 family element transposase accessory protein TnpB [Clostridium sp. AM33-3]RHT20040.1 transposase [Clostridium sp. AM33-3]